MEVDEGGGAQLSRVMSGGSSTAGSVSVSLHPLVIMNISDHFTRVRVQQEEGGAPIGALQLKTTLPHQNVNPYFLQCMERYLVRRKEEVLRFATPLS